jgi:hypothetical protein
VSKDDATRVADLAFSAWNNASCIGGTPAVQAYNAGFLDFVPDGGTCSPSSECHPLSNDVIYFRDDGWPYSDSLNPIALTTVSYGKKDGVVFQAYTEVNTAEYSFTTQGTPPPGSYDLQSILTHEAGHFLGLAHAPALSAVMYYANDGEVKTTLTSDDVAGICAIYPATPPSWSCQTTPGVPGLFGFASALSVVLLAACRASRPRRIRL